MSSSALDVTAKAKDYWVWIAYNKNAFINTNSSGYAVFSQFSLWDISNQNLEIGFIFFAGDNIDDQFIVTEKVRSKD